MVHHHYDRVRSSDLPLKKRPKACVICHNTRTSTAKVTLFFSFAFFSTVSAFINGTERLLKEQFEHPTDEASADNDTSVFIRVQWRSTSSSANVTATFFFFVPPDTIPFPERLGGFFHEMELVLRVPDEQQIESLITPFSHAHRVRCCCFSTPILLRLSSRSRFQSPTL